MIRYSFCAVVAIVCVVCPAMLADEPPQPTEQVASPLGPTERLLMQLSTLNQALAADPANAKLLARRAQTHAALGDPERAIADYDELLKRSPDEAALYDARGSEHFKLGQIDASIADFDRAIGLDPELEAWHWKRGISYYYASRWEEGRKQFEGYQQVDDNDVENAVWRFLCMARKDGVPAARADLLKIKRDTRVPMREIYELYAGRAQPSDVLAAAAAGSPSPEEANARQFYAHLYLGLFHEAAADPAAKSHLDQACQHKIGHYMWNVADVHAKRLAKQPEK